MKKAPLLIQFEGDAHTVHAFRNQKAFDEHIELQEARAKANGFKTQHDEATRQARKTDVFVIHRGDKPAPLPTLRQVRAILKQYKDGAR